MVTHSNTVMAKSGCAKSLPSTFQVKNHGLQRWTNRKTHQCRSYQKLRLASFKFQVVVQAWEISRQPELRVRLRRRHCEPAESGILHELVQRTKTENLPSSLHQHGPHEDPFGRTNYQLHPFCSENLQKEETPRRNEKEHRKTWKTRTGKKKSTMMKIRELWKITDTQLSNSNFRPQLWNCLLRNSVTSCFHHTKWVMLTPFEYGWIVSKYLMTAKTFLNKLYYNRIIFLLHWSTLVFRFQR